MKKTIRIRLFLFLAVVGSFLSYATAYYFNYRQEEKRMAQEEILKNQEFEMVTTERSLESATVVLPYEFILSYDDEYVVVYHADRKTLYSNTDIRISSLPVDLQKEIAEGKEIYSEEELYNFLENYSS